MKSSERTLSDSLEVLLRVIPEHKDLQPALIRSTLGIRPADHFSIDEDRDIAILEFEPGSDLTVREERIRWQQPKFRTACEWLRERSPASFQTLTNEGLRIDLYIGQYWGYVPLELLEQVVRLKLHLWFSDG